MIKVKSLWKISAVTTREAEDAVAEMLGGIFDCRATSFFDAERNKAIVSVYLSKKIPRKCRDEIREGLKRIENCGLKTGAEKIEVKKIRREDWANSWKRHFKPIEIGKSLLAKPSWNKKQPRKNQKVVVLDPGLSFGTGQHPTTAFCLREIVRASQSKVMARENARLTEIKSFLDIGTGSGILVIAAAKLGYEPVRAIDFDSEAIRVAKANAKINKVFQRMKIAHGEVSKLETKPGKQFDLVCANLISDLLIAERKRIAARLKCGGLLVLSGILKSEFSEVQKAFEEIGLKLVSAKSEKEWRSGLFRAGQKMLKKI